MLGFLFKRKVESAARESVDRFLASDRAKVIVDNAIGKAISDVMKSDQVKRLIDQEIRKNPRLMFVLAMRDEMLRVDPTMDRRKAFNVAVRVLNEFLADEKIAFGAEGWDWSHSGARTMIRENEIEHWERIA